MTLLGKQIGEKVDVELDVKLAMIIHVHHTGLPIKISVINCAFEFGCFRNGACQNIVSAPAGAVYCTLECPKT